MIEQTVSPKTDKAQSLFVDSYEMVVKKGKILDPKVFKDLNIKYEKTKNQYGDSLKKKFKRNKINASEFVLTGISAAVTGVFSGGVVPVVGFLGKVIGVPVVKKFWRDAKHYGKVSTALAQGKIKHFGGNIVEIFDTRTLAEHLIQKMREDTQKNSNEQQHHLFKHIRHNFNHKRHENITTYVNLVMVMRTYYDRFKDQYNKKIRRNGFSAAYSCSDFIHIMQLVFAYYKAYRKSLDFAATFTACYHYVETEVNKIETQFERDIRVVNRNSRNHTIIRRSLGKFLKNYNAIYLRYKDSYPVDGTMENRKISSTRRLRALNLSPNERYKAEVAYKINQYYLHSVLARIMMCSNYHQDSIKAQTNGETYFDCLRKKLEIENDNIFWNRADRGFRDSSHVSGRINGISKKKTHGAGFNQTFRNESGVNTAIYGGKPIITSTLNSTGQKGAGVFTNSTKGYEAELGKRINPMSSLWTEARQAMNIIDIGISVGFTVLRAYNARRNLKKLKQSDQKGESLYNSTLRHDDKNFKRLHILRTNMKKGLLEGWQDAFLDYDKSDKKLRKTIIKEDYNYPLEGVFFERHNALLKLLWYHHYMKEFYEEVVEKVDRMTLRWMIMTDETVHKMDVFFDESAPVGNADKHEVNKTCHCIFCYSDANPYTNDLHDKREDWIINNTKSNGKNGFNYPLSKSEIKQLNKIQENRKTILKKWGSNQFFTGEHMDDIIKQFKKKKIWKKRLEKFASKREGWIQKSKRKVPAGLGIK